MSNLKKEIDSEESSNDAKNIIQIESSLSKMKQFFSKNNEKDYSTPNENLKKIQSIYKLIIVYYSLVHKINSKNYHKGTYLFT